VFLFGTPALLTALALLLTHRQPLSLLWRSCIVLVGPVAVAVLMYLFPDAGSPSFEPAGFFLLIGLPVTACLWFAQSTLARKRPWLSLIAIPTLWAAGLFIGPVLAMNLDLARS
jgi:hypothetical protein